MCTLTWLRSEEGYELLFNRDELAARRPALPPAVHQLRGVRWLAPIDGEAGGTWLLANELGLSIAVRNGAGTWRGDAAASSRGLLAASLADSGGTDVVAARLEGADLAPFRPFSLFALEPGAPALLADWDGERLDARRIGDDAQPLTSSSVDPQAVDRARRALFERMAAAAGGIDRDLLERFHASHEPSRGPLSPCMHREDGSTVSQSRIRVGAGEVELSYRPGPPCEGAPAVSLALARRRPARARGG